MGLCCVRHEGSGMGVVVLNAMRGGVGTLAESVCVRVLTCLKNSPALGHSTCVERELLIFQRKNWSGLEHGEDNLPG